MERLVFQPVYNGNNNIKPYLLTNTILFYLIFGFQA